MISEGKQYGYVIGAALAAPAVQIRPGRRKAGEGLVRFFRPPEAVGTQVNGRLLEGHLCIYVGKNTEEQQYSHPAKNQMWFAHRC